MTTRIHIATDGSALGNPGPGGWAWVHLSGPGCSSGASGGQTTNNAMELTAIGAALAAHRDQDVVIHSDSQYAINCLTKWVHGWRRRGWTTAAGAPVANRELIEKILALMEGRTVEFVWVRGHDGHAANERVDALARAAAARG